jgi:sec-independent protein translocase protein TatA
VPIGPWEIVVILLILVIIFGAGRLSQVGGALGKSVREFRGAIQDEPHHAAAAPAVTVTAPPVTCATCQATNPATNRFCSSCGGDLSTQATPPSPADAPPQVSNTCPSCATVNPPGQAFCGQCGTRLTVAA